jgi:membrane protein implicated in regulation of membrane protease activity
MHAAHSLRGAPDDAATAVVGTPANSTVTAYTGKLYFALMVSVLLSCAAAWIIARRYRRRMQQLMRAPHVVESAAPAVQKAPDDPPLPVSLADNRSTGMRLTMLLIALSCLVALSSACIWWRLTLPGEALTPTGVAVVALLHLWPRSPRIGAGVARRGADGRDARFTWIEASHFEPSKHREVLVRLFG